MTSRFIHQAGSLAAITAMLFSVPAVVRAENAGGLGSISTCPAAPEIAATAVSFALSPQSGLTLFQANAATLTIIRQSCISTPNLAPQIARQAVLAISRSAALAANRSAALPNGTSPADALAAQAAVGVSATTGYSEIIQTVLRGAIQGCASTGMTTTDLKNILSAVCSAIVIESAKQAGASAALSQQGPLPVEKSLPMDNAEHAVAVIKEVVATFSKTAAALGIPQVEIAGSINLAGQEAMETAKKITAETIAAEVSGLAAGRMARDVAVQVALQVAQQVAKEVAAQIVAQVYQSVLGTQEAADQSKYGTTLPTAPGEVRPGPFPNPPVPTPTPFPTPPPTPVPTPTPPSPR